MTDFYNNSAGAYDAMALSHPTRAKLYVHPSFSNTLAGSYWTDINENYSHVLGMMTLAKLRAQRRPTIKTYCAGFTVSTSANMAGLATSPTAFWNAVLGSGVRREDTGKYQNDGISGKGGGLQFNTPPWAPMCFPMPTLQVKALGTRDASQREVTIAYSLPQTNETDTNSILEGYEIVVTDRPDQLYTKVHEDTLDGTATWYDEWTYPFFQTFDEEASRGAILASTLVTATALTNNTVQIATLRLSARAETPLSVGQKAERLYLCFLPRCNFRSPSVTAKTDEVTITFQQEYTPPARLNETPHPMGLRSATTEWGDFAVHGRSGVGYYLALVEGENSRLSAYHVMHNGPQMSNAIKNTTGDIAGPVNTLAGHDLCVMTHPSPPMPKADRGSLRYDCAMRNIDDYKSEEGATGMPARFVPLPPISVYSVVIH